MIRWPLAIFAFLLIGCGSDDSKAVGEWKGTFTATDGKTFPGANLTLTKEHHWRELYRNLDVEGRWKLSDGIVTLNTELISGLLVADAKKKYLEHAAKVKNPEQYKAMADNLDKPIILNLSADGKTLRRNEPGPEGSTVYAKQ